VPAHDPVILGADTSLPVLSVALIRGDAIIGTLAVEGRSSRNEKLLPAIDWLLRESGVERNTIDLFAVTRGPGSFTGVRIGLATIQGLALALGRPVCAMSTHEAIAPLTGSASVVDDAGRGEFYVSEFESGAPRTAPRLASAGDVEQLTGVIRASDFIQNANLALACARRARDIASRDALAAYADVTPIYVRLAEAEVKLQQKR
jgi:tRNA threonylcarbamoyl adenosine modification protein YeaZ